MGTNDHVAVTERVGALPPNGREPLPHERKLLARHKRRRADIQERGLRGVETERHEEFLGRHLPPQSENVSNRGAPATRTRSTGKPWSAGSLTALPLVPHEHPVRTADGDAPWC
jgi:hypothetical protein